MPRDQPSARPVSTGRQEQYTAPGGQPTTPTAQTSSQEPGLIRLSQEGGVSG